MFRGFGRKDKNKAAKSQTSASAPNHARTGSGQVQSGSGSDGASAKGASAPAPAPVTTAHKFDNLTLLNAPALRDVSPSDKPKLFLAHLKLCQEIFDFSKTTKLKEKEAKRLLLLGLVEHVNSPSCRLRDGPFAEIVAMISANIFRSLSPTNEFPNDDEDEPPVELAWPHLQIVYEFLLRFVVSNDVEPKVAKRYVSQTFILQLLSLFNSEDVREREYLKTILHRIYGKFMSLRSFIRRSITNVFLGAVYQDDKHNGIAELLEILGSIINGFALPLKTEHKKFLNNALIPLHKIHTINNFHGQLEYCVSQYIEKDAKMAETVILGLLRIWPEINSTKQVLFLHELEEVLELTQLAEFRAVVNPLFQRIAKCLRSQHFQVAERALVIWNNEYVFTLISQNRAQILPLVFDALRANAEEHWNGTVQGLSQNVLKFFQDNYKMLYEDVAKSADEASQRKAQDRMSRAARWDELAAQLGVHGPLAQEVLPPGPPGVSMGPGVA